MYNLYSYDVLVNDVFYRCCHILDYYSTHLNMSELEKESIKATIMDALVYKGLIDPSKQSLDLDNLCIVDNLDHYIYEEYPNICGIPLWMKEEFRKKCLCVTGGAPISIYLSRPPSKFTRFCVYDPNIAVSAIFDDATFYNALYLSPTRGVFIEETRPFVEIKLGEELYLVDVLTKRILKSSWFKKNYQFKVVNKQEISKMSKKKLKNYNEFVRENVNLSFFITSILPMLEELDIPNQAEMKYEYEQTKKYFPEEWVKAEEFQREMNLFLKKN